MEDDVDRIRRKIESGTLNYSTDVSTDGGGISAAVTEYAKSEGISPFEAHQKLSKIANQQRREREAKQFKKPPTGNGCLSIFIRAFTTK